MHVENKRASHLQVHCNPLLTVDRENVRKKINNLYKELLGTLLNAKTTWLYVKRLDLE